MRSGTIALLAGVVLLYQLPAVPSFWWMLPLPALAYFWRRFRHPGWRLLVCFILGFCWSAAQAQLLLSDRLPRALQGEDLVVVGVIDSIPRKQPHAWRFDFAVQRLEHGIDRRDHPRRIRLNWYGAEAIPLRAGDRWRLVVRLKRPHGFYNPGGFDYEGYLFRQGIGATGYVRHADLAQRLNRHWYDAPLQRLRQWLRDRLLSQLGDRPLSGIVVALAVGERGGISDTQWEILRNTGTAHLIAISGLHVGLLAGLAFFAFNRLWRAHPRLLLWQPAPRIAALAALFCATLYAALAGFSLPTQRALIMVSTVLIAVIAQQRVRPSHTLALSLCIVLLYDSTAVLSAGFWLSFGAVAVILYLFAGHVPRPGRWWQWGRLQWGVSLGLVPLLLLFFQEASIVSPLANFIAVPVVSLIVVPATLLLTAIAPLVNEPPELLLQTLDVVLGGLWRFLQMIQEGGWATWVTPSIPVVALLLAMAGVVILFLPRGLPHRYLGAILFVPLLFPGLAPPRQGQFELTVLDVGQGLAAVVQTAHHVLVFDAGPRYSSGFNTGDAVVLPFLAHLGVSRIDTLVISHGDIDHRGGAPALLGKLEVGQLRSGYPLGDTLQGPPNVLCARGEQWSWDDVEFEFLHPDANWRRRLSSENNASCVLRVSSGEHSVMLSADIESEAERFLLANQPHKLESDVLVVPHHGSKTSSLAAFIEAVSPQYAVFPVGYRNRFGFPDPGVYTRYRRRGISTLRTGYDGAVRFVIDPANGLSEPDAYRRAARRLWHGEPD